MSKIYQVCPLCENIYHVDNEDKCMVCRKKITYPKEISKMEYEKILNSDKKIIDSLNKSIGDNPIYEPYKKYVDKNSFSFHTDKQTNIYNVCPHCDNTYYVDQNDNCMVCRKKITVPKEKIDLPENINKEEFTKWLNEKSGIEYVLSMYKQGRKDKFYIDDEKYYQFISENFLPNKKVENIEKSDYEMAIIKVKQIFNGKPKKKSLIETIFSFGM